MDFFWASYREHGFESVYVPREGWMPTSAPRILSIPDYYDHKTHIITAPPMDQWEWYPTGAEWNARRMTTLGW